MQKGDQSVQDLVASVNGTEHPSSHHLPPAVAGGSLCIKGSF